METLNITHILGRTCYAEQMKTILENFEKNKNKDSTIKSGIYVYGMPGTGKSYFVNEVLKSLDYDTIRYDAGDVRNKGVIETITQNNMTDRNVMHMFSKKIKKIAIVMDEIDGMNSGDKGGINTLIKIVREKKTKKQRTEDITYNPIVCIGNYKFDKKIKELMKVCHVIELPEPTIDQMRNVVRSLLPESGTDKVNEFVNYAQKDLRRLHNIYALHSGIQQKKRNGNLRDGSDNISSSLFELKTYNEDTKAITKNLINTRYDFTEHVQLINETDRTIIGLLWHENIIDSLSKLPPEKSLPIYHKILTNICFADYIDRITFQKQIWQFNEMSSIIKTFYNHQLYHQLLTNEIQQIEKRPSSRLNAESFRVKDIRFTKVLTKYSTEYNNTTFIQGLCHKMGMDKQDLRSYFSLIQSYNNDDMLACMDMLESMGVTKLDVNRMMRYKECRTSVTRNTSLPEDEVVYMEDDM